MRFVLESDAKPSVVVESTTFLAFPCYMSVIFDVQYDLMTEGAHNPQLPSPTRDS